MHKKFLSALLISILPVLSYAADITVNNNTKSHATGQFNVFFKVCSSTLGDKGVIKPGQQGFVVPESIISTSCGSKDCEAFIYETTNCSGNRIATAVVNAKTGIIDVRNEAPTRYTINFSATKVDVSEPNRGFKAWFTSLFS